MGSIMRNGLTFSESGKIGGVKTAAIWKNKKKHNIRQYNKNPKKCSYCKKTMPYHKRRNKFCSHQCAGYSNKGRKEFNNNCLFCKNKIETSKKYCSKECVIHHKRKILINKIEKGKLKLKNNESYRVPYKRYLINKYGIQCQICLRKTWNNKKVPLVLDHKDGNPYNWDLKNIRIICHNCNAQTETFAGKNIGKGRKSRREFYKKHGYS